MDSLHLTAEEIKLKVLKLLGRLEQLEKRYNEVQVENSELKKQIQEQKNSMKALEETNKMLKIAETLHQKDETGALKKMIAGYIKEIDECLRLLSNK
jgi:hypothetical protein